MNVLFFTSSFIFLFIAALEDLSKNDPEGYKKFIADQKKEAAEEKKRREGLYIPEKCFCVATQRMDKDKSKYHFINFCTSTEVPVCQDQMGNPADSSVPIGKLVIPFSIGIWRDDTHKEKPCRAVDVVYHPKTVDRANQDPYFRMQIIELAFKHIEEDHSCKLHRRYKELKKMKYKGKHPTTHIHRSIHV